MPAAGAASLVDVLCARADQQAAQTAYVFLDDGETPSRSFSYAALDGRTRAIAARLQAMDLAGQRALLLYPPGLDYVEAFFGCLYAGVVAVPAYPPTRHHLARLRAIVADAAPAVVLATEALQQRLEAAAPAGWESRALPWVATDTIASAGAADWRHLSPAAGDTAFLQYTSGSTGDPRGVIVSHGNLLANQELIRRAFGHTADSTVVGWLPLYHDMGLIGNLLQPLYVGSTAVLMSPLAFLEKPVRWLRAISEYRASTSGGPNFAYELCARRITDDEKRGLDLSAWTLAFNGAEPVRAATLERFAAAFADCGFRRQSFFPCYGLAEATLFVTGPDRERKQRPAAVGTSSGSRADAASGADGVAPPVACGRPWGGQALRIVDPETRVAVPDDTVGEIWVAGPSIARGYWNRPEESAATFGAELAADGAGLQAGERTPHRRYLRTGDLGYVERGELYVTGRIKDLIIVRGRNYYPHDLEAAVDALTDLLRPGAQAAFALLGEPEDAVALVAEVQRDAYRKLGAEALFTAMRRALAEACELPDLLLVLVPPGVVPKTSSGKIRRRACRDALLAGTLTELARSDTGSTAGGLEAQPAPARHQTLERLAPALREAAPQQRAGLIAEHLRAAVAGLLRVPVSEISPVLPLRDFGLDSLRIVELQHALDQALGAEVPLAELLAETPLVELAARLAVLPARVPARSEDESAAETFPLSYAQRAMWTVHRLEPDSLGYNLHLALRLTGAFDPERLRAALLHVGREHPMLRTVYADTVPEPSQRLEPADEPIAFEWIDATDWPAERLQPDLTDRARRPFALSRLPVARASVYTLGTDEHLLLLCAHHIALDLWSLLLVLREAQAAYHGPCPAAETSGAAASYCAFVDWQRTYLASDRCERDWDYWRDCLAGPLPVLNLPQQAGAGGDYCGASVRLDLDTALVAELKALARAQGATLFTVLLAAYKVLLHRDSGQTDLIVGVASHGRVQPRFAGTVGNFVNPLAIRSGPTPERPFAAFLAEVREVVLGATRHQDFPFPLLVERLAPERHAGRWPIYQTWFVLQQAQAPFGPDAVQLALGEDGAPFPWGEATASTVALAERVENFELKLMAAETADGLTCSFQYRTEMFTPDAIERLAANFGTLLGSIAADPLQPLGDLPLLAATERASVLTDWNATAADFGPATTVPALFAAQVRRTPDAPALEFGDTTLSYRELAARVRTLSARLQARGVGAETVVAIAARRSIELVVGLLGILEAGAAYLPLEPEYPLPRLAAMIEDAGARWVLIEPALVDLLAGLPGEKLPLVSDAADADELAGSWRDPVIAPEHLAYVLYTSGSTGRPKGVGIPHRGLVNRLLWMQQCFGLAAGDAVLQKTPYSFDVSVWEFFWPLLTGARLVVAVPDAHRDAEQLAATIARHRVTTVHFVPSMLRAFLETPGIARCGALRRVICSGEALTPELRDRSFERLGAELHNLYGPTEASIDVSHWACERSVTEPEVPIGRPIANTQLYVLDGRLHPAPVGVSGELYIGGIQLARGYLNRPGLTAERFVPDPFGPPGARLYRTGDLAHWRPDGAIAYDGRVDHQVKVRGFRIELGEIEARLLECSGVRAAAVLARSERPGEAARLVAYVVDAITEQDAGARREALQSELRTLLPEHMVPGVWVFLAELPLTNSGKIDRKALPAPELTGPAAEHTPPQTPFEQRLAAIWAELLGLERIGVHDNFFALGGDSILAIQVASRAHQAGIRIIPKQLFEYQTVATLARAAVPVEGTVAEQGRVSGEVPLTPIQRWFFAQALPAPWHWNQAVLLACAAPIREDLLRRALAALLAHHDALRLRFEPGEDGWRQFHGEPNLDAVLVREDVSEVPADALAAAIATRAAEWQARFDLARGPLFRAVWFARGGEGADRLLLIAHHLIVDLVSWHILLEDLDRLCRPDAPSALPAKTSAYRDWALRLVQYAEALPAATDSGSPEHDDVWPVERTEGSNTEAAAAVLTVALPAAATQALLTEVPAAARASVPELLLAALGAALTGWADRPTVAIDIEAHGRDTPFDELDLTRTVGWFTTLFTVRLDALPGMGPGRRLQHAKARARSAAEAGFAAFAVASPRGAAAPLLFNYQGSRDLATTGLRQFAVVDGPVGPLHGSANPRHYELELNAWVAGERLQFEWAYSAERYRAATIAALAERTLVCLEELLAECRNEDACGLAPVDFPLARLTAEELTRLPVPMRQIEDIYPLAPMQDGLLFHTLMAPESGIYLMQDRYALSGAVDPAAVRAAWQGVVDRHPVLRTSFVWADVGQPHQIVHRSAVLPFEYHDWRELPAAEQQRRLDDLLAAELTAGFDLARAPLVRVRLFRLGETEYEMVRSHHHILTDAWCTSLILTDFKRCYQALAAGRPVPADSPRPFRDYLAWLQRQDPTPSERYWRRSLAGLREATPLVVDRNAAVDGAAGEVADAVLLLSEPETAALNRFAQRHQLTPNTVVQAAWALLLSRYSGLEDIVFGVTVAGRPAELTGIEATLGLFINSLPLRLRVPAGQPVLDFLRALLQANLELRQHEHTPLVDVQAASEIPRGEPLFQHLYVYENTPLAADLRAEAAGVRMSELAVRTQTNYPLTAVIIPGECLHLQITYQCRRFEAEAVERMLSHFRNLVVGLIEQADGRLVEVPLLAADEHDRIVRDWNGTEQAIAGAAGGFVGAFEAQAERRPEAIAVECAGERATYRALNERANALAWGLRAQGVGPETVVALLDDRSIDLLVAIVAVFKARGAYLPLDPAHPDGRIASVLMESRAPVLIAGTRHRGRAAALCRTLTEAPALLTEARCRMAGRTENLGLPADPDDLAYVIYTSGSTGTPKGAMVEQRGLFNNLMTKVPALGLSECDVIAQTASQCFDISVWQFLTAPAIGARIEIVPDDIARDPAALLRALAERAVTIFEAVPSLIAALLEVAGAGDELPALRWLLPSGEAFPPDQCRRWMSRYPKVALLNAYGPAECSDDVSYHPIAWPDDVALSVPIGRPVANTRLYVLDRNLAPLPVGVPGEICVGGPQVGRGYLHAPRLTAAAFVPDPFGAAGARLYRTGDLGRFRVDGVLEFVGRVDHQVKIRGHRIEPGEIEACLTAHPGITEAVVVPTAGAGGTTQLVAYLVGAPLSQQALREHLGRTVPQYMIPAAFVFLAALPLNANGKIDRRRLPEPELREPSGEAGAVPRTPTEELLVAIWSEVLGVPQLGTADNFFELGGHSLLATQVMSRIRRAFHVELPLRTLFAEPTVAGLAAAVDQARAEPGRALPPIQPIERTAYLPLSRAQERLWYAQQLDPDNPFYNFRVALRVTGRLDLAVLEQAVGRLRQRHESLRTRFVERDGQPVQVIDADGDWSLTTADLTEFPESVRDEALVERMTTAARVPFDLARGPVLRLHAYRLGPAPGEDAPRFGLLLVVHHLVFDGWSMITFFHELSALYTALREDRPDGLPELTLHYADYAAWQQALAAHPALAHQVDFWRGQLAGAPALSAFPTDRPRSPEIGTLAAHHAFDLSPLSEALQCCGRERAVSPFMLGFAAYHALLHYLSGAEDQVIGADIAGRNRRETEPLIGFFINLLPLRIRLDRNASLAELVRQVRDLTLAAYAHQDLPFDRVLETARVERVPGAAPLFQAKLVFHNIPLGKLGLPGLQIETLAIETGRTELDLVLHLHQRGEALQAVFEYRIDLFDAPTIERFAALYRAILEHVLTSPELTLAELQGLLAEQERQRRDAALAERRRADLGRLAERRGQRQSRLSGGGTER